jgi:Zn-dependent peptidase ImmA (M78 family)/transcriptional regulator with XRE-family HTH domain
VDVSDRPAPEQLSLPENADDLDVEPSVLVWARESIGLPPDRAARRMGVSVATLARWETGAATPTLPQLRKAAAAYKRPLAVLLLPRPARDFDALRDFRSGTVGRHAVSSPELTSEYWRALTQREVLLELVDLGALPEAEAAPATGIRLDTPPEEAGARIREWIGVDRTSWAKPGLALSGWLERAEDKGILIVQTRRVPTAEMAGFSMSDWPHPIVALNGSDFQRRRLFTLVHELAHLALNAGGVCDMREDRTSNHAEDRIELYCNRVAAAALMPGDVVMSLAMVARARIDRPWTTAELDGLARAFGTSAESTLLRLITLGKATWELYWSRKPEFQKGYEEARERRSESDSGPSYYVVKARDLGHGYVRVVLDAFRSRVISSLDVADYLDIRFDQLSRLEDAAR